MQDLQYLLRPSLRPDVHFLAPLPLEECLERLEKRQGTFFNIEIDVLSHQIDVNQFNLQIPVNRKDKNAFDITVYGTLQRQDAANTLVRISQHYTQHPPSGGVLVVMLLLLGFTLLLAVQNIVALVFPLLAAFTFFAAGRDNFKEIAHMIEETLGARTSNDKAKNNEAP